MTSRRIVHRIEVALEYTGGKDQPERGIFRNYPVDPKHTGELVIAIRSEQDPVRDRPYNPAQHGAPQVHLAGTPRALEELGRYFIALARLDSDDPEPSGSLDNVRNADGGTLRVIPRRLPPGKRPET